MNHKGEEILKSIGEQDDHDIDLIEASFALAMRSGQERDSQFYRDQFQTMAQDLAVLFEMMCGQENSDDVTIQAKALKHLMVKQYSFSGDENHYDDLENINMFDVFDRRKGIPISLCIIAIALCRHQGWCANGINFPGHFLMRLEKDGGQVILDPFQGCVVLDAADLRLILKKVMGDHAELSADYYAISTNRDILLRLQNNLKYRLIDTQAYQEALDIVKQMAWIAPDDCRLDLDKAVLYARTEQPQSAIKAISRYIDHVTDPKDKAEAEHFLYQLKTQLN